VYSLLVIIKIQKRSVVQFLDQEFQTTEGGFYRPLENERRGRVPVVPFRERKVPMTEEEDVDKEHVLYVNT